MLRYCAYALLPTCLPQRRIDPLLPAWPVGLEKIQDVAVDAQRQPFLGGFIARRRGERALPLPT